MDSQLQIQYFESMVRKLKVAEEIETDLQKLVEIGQLLNDAEKELINLRLEHVRHNTLDNRKKYLRVCTQSENCRNRKKK